MFRIEWVAKDSDYNPHLHCDACGITAKGALSEDEAVEFEGYDDKPEAWEVCDTCEEWFDVKLSNSYGVCNYCDIR